MKIRIFLSIFILIGFCKSGIAQVLVMDTIPRGIVMVTPDYRIDALAKKMREYNAQIAYRNSTTAKGYRLMVLTTSDRAQALQIRTKLLQQYPDQQVYMSYQLPYIKLKFGDYVDKAEAENVRKELVRQNLVTGNIYLLSEIVKVKPDKSLLEEGNK